MAKYLDFPENVLTINWLASCKCAIYSTDSCVTGGTGTFCQLSQRFTVTGRNSLMCLSGYVDSFRSTLVS